MEYLIGSLLTLFVMVVLSRGINSETKKNFPLRINYSQSYTYDLLRPVLPYLIPELRRLKPSQSTEHSKRTQIRVIFTRDQAYWITANTLYVADLINGIVDEESIEKVDTMGMDKVQLDKMLFIMDKLREGINDDSRGSGDK